MFAASPVRRSFRSLWPARGRSVGRSGRRSQARQRDLRPESLEQRLALSVNVFEPADWATNDTLDTAFPVQLVAGQASIDATIGDGFHGSLDVDLFAVEVPAGSRLRAEVFADRIGSSLDSYLRLFDADGNQLAFNDDIEDGRSSYFLDSRLDYYASTGSTFYVGVSGYGNSFYDPTEAASGRAGDVGPYTLQISVVAEEPNDTLATATPIELVRGGRGAFVERFIGDGAEGARDVDFYAVEVPGGFALTVYASPLGEEGQAVVRLFDAAGTELDWVDSASEGSDFFLTGPKAAATTTFFVAVSGAGNDDYDPMVAGSGEEGEVGEYSLDFYLERILEPNDTILTATVVDLLPVATGISPAAWDWESLGSPGALNGSEQLSAFFETELGDGEHGDLDVDMYSVEVPAGQRLEVYLGGVGGLARLFDAEGAEISWLAVAQYEFGEGDEFLAGTFVAPVNLSAAVTYFVGISGNGNDAYDPTVAGSGTPGLTGGYFLEFFTTDSFEPNDTLATATPFTWLIGEESEAGLSGFIGDGAEGARDVDIYAIEMPVGFRLTVGLNYDSEFGGPAPVVRLFDQAGLELQWELTEYGEEEFGYVYLVGPQAAATTTFFVAVSGAGNSVYDPTVAGSGEDGALVSYSLFFDRERGDVEPNDTIDTATVVVLLPFVSGLSTLAEELPEYAEEGDSFSGLFIGDGEHFALDVDIFRVDVRPGGTLTVGVYHDDLQVLARLFDAEGEEIDWDRIEPFDDWYTAYSAPIMPGATTYFVGISAFDNDDYDPAVAASGTPGETGEYSVDFVVQFVPEPELPEPTNAAPTNIVLSASSIAENNAVGAVVGTFTTTDPDSGDTFTYTLVSGAGDADNGSFTIVGGELRAAASFNFEAKNSYSVRVRATDAGGLFTEKEFTITVEDVAAEPLVIAGVTPPEPGVYGLGQKVRFTIAFSDTVVVRGKPRLEVRSGTRVRSANYVSGGGTAELTFEYVVGRNEVADVVSLGQKFLLSKKNSIASATATLPGPLPVGLAGAAAAGVRLDAVPPKAVGRVQVPAAGSYTVGQNLDFVVRFTEVVFVSGSPQIALTGFSTFSSPHTGAARQATYVSGSGTDSLTFSYEVRVADALGRGKRLGLGKSIVLPSGFTIVDEAGNRAAVKISAPSLKGIQIDGSSPPSSFVSPLASLAWAGLGDAGGPSSPSARTAAFAAMG